MSKFRKKPVVVEATQWLRHGDHSMVDRYVGAATAEGRMPCEHCGLSLCDHGAVKTLQGRHIVCPGDWIIKTVKGEFYPCKPDIFATDYEPADASASNAMTFGHAIEAAKQGRRIARAGWNGKGIYVLRITCANGAVARCDGEPKFVAGIGSFLAIDTTGLESDNPDAVRSVVPWLASQTDMLAEDWIIVE